MRLFGADSSHGKVFKDIATGDWIEKPFSYERGGESNTIAGKQGGKYFNIT